MPVEIIAHRGASRDCLENTLEAFQRALDQGADAFELDVHATRDGVVVVHHDPDVAVEAAISLPRTAPIKMSDPLKYSSAAPLPGPPVTAPIKMSDPLIRSDAIPRRLTINAVDYTTLRDVRLQNGERMPTLDDVLSLAGTRATVYVEVKGLRIESDVIACLARHPNTRTAVHSFDHRIPRTIVGRMPGIPIGILSASYVLDWPGMINAAHARDLWQQTALIDQALMDAAHACGARVVAWTENDVAHASELAQMGVDAICTDVPEVIRAGLIENGLL